MSTMPEAFDRCVKEGGKVVTETLSGGRYRHVCYKGKKRYEGHVKHKKFKGKKKPDRRVVK